jgi:hypothetical protein
MKINLKKILLLAAIGGVFVALTSYGIARKAPAIRSAANFSFQPDRDTIPPKKKHSSLTTTDTTKRGTVNKAVVQPPSPPKHSAKKSHAAQSKKIQK